MASRTDAVHRPAIESLESRMLLSSGVVKLLAGTGTLRVICHRKESTVVNVSVGGGNILVSMARDLTGDAPVVVAFAAPVIRKLHVIGGRQADTVSINLAAGDLPRARVRVHGGRGDDVIVGSAGADFLSGGPGNDTLDGRLGGDYLSGGPGNDRLDGGREPVPEVPGQEDADSADDVRDALVGGPGFDVLIFADEDVFLPGKGPNQVVQP